MTASTSSARSAKPCAADVEGDVAVERCVADRGQGVVLDDLGLFADVDGPLDVDAPDPSGCSPGYTVVLMGTSPVDRHQVSPNAIASSLAAEPSYPMTTRLAIVRL